MSDNFKQNLDLALNNTTRLSNKVLIDGVEYELQFIKLR